MKEQRTCNECGTDLPANAPQGLCPRCLANIGLGLLHTAVLPKSDFQVERTGTMIGRYKLLEKIGEGGFGVVYMAEQVEPVQRKVALKIIKAGMDTKEVIARFEAERQAIALMDHPNIARALDAGATAAGRPYFVMELVRGIPITEYCDQSNLPTRERLQLFMKVCQAVQHAHQKGVIHRDLKPSNVLVTEHDGEPVPKVIDFGVAKALGQKLTEKTLFTGFQHMIGTPAYMSPEQAALSGLDIDTRADIYSLGVLLYELLTGVTPFDADTFRKEAMDEIRRMIRDTEPPKPSTRLQTLGDRLTEVAKHRRTAPAALSRLICGDLDWIVMKCLEKDRKRRYETANGLATDVARHLTSEPVAARPPSSLYRFQKLVRRHRLAFATACAVAAALVLGLGVSTWALLREKEARRRAVVAEGKATSETKRARTAAEEVTMTLAASDFLQAVQLVAEDNGGDALPYLVRSLSSNPTNAGALTRLATLLTHHSWMLPRLTLKHDKQVAAAEFSADGKQVVTSSGDKAKIWDTQTGCCLIEVSAHGMEIHAVQLSPDGKRIATASGDTVVVWDAQSGRPLGEPLKHGHRVSLMQFSPDGKRIVTTTGTTAPDWDRVNYDAGDSIAHVWDAESGRPLTPPLKHGGRVNSVRFSPDGKRIVTASDDKSVCVWDAETGRLLTGPLKHSGKVLFAEFSPDGKRIVTSPFESPASVWDAQSGELVIAGFNQRAGVLSARFSPDGSYIVTCSAESCSDDRTVQVWDAQSGQPLATRLMHIGEGDSAQFSPDGKMILTISTDGTVYDDKTDRWCKTARVWDAQSGEPWTEPLQHGKDVWSARFSPHGERITTISAKKAALIWGVQPPAAVCLKYNGTVTPAEFSSDGKRIFSPDGARIVTASSNGTARVWDAQSGRLLMESLRHGNEVRWAEFSSDGKWIVTASSDKTARVWDSQNGRPRTEPLVHPGAVESAQFSPDGKLIVTVSECVRVWDAQSGQLRTEVMSPGKHVNSAHFSPDGGRILTASDDGSACVWDARSGKACFGPLKHGDRVATAQFSPDGKRIVTASDDRTARVWDAESGQPQTGPIRHGFLVVSAQFSPDGKQIVTVDMNGKTRVWDSQNGQPLTESLELHATSAQFSPDGKQVVTASEDGNSARVWDIAPLNTAGPDWMLQMAEAISGKVLNKRNVLEETKLDRVETLEQIRQKLNAEPSDDDWVVWGRWFLADPSTRTISPFSKITVPEYIEGRIKEHTTESLDEAERLAAGNPGLLQQISQARNTLEQTK